MKRRKAVRCSETGEIYFSDATKGGWAAVEADHEPPAKLGVRDREVMCFSTRPTETFEVLNDLVVDRGPSPYVSLLELFGELMCGRTRIWED
jgi:NAD+ kinase